MRMKDAFEAYFDDFDSLNVYMSKNLFDGKSRIFHLKDSKHQIIHLTIQSQSDLYNGYTHYHLSLDDPIEVGEEYTIFDEHCKSVICQYSHIVKTEKFNNEYFYLGDDLGLTYSNTQSVFKIWSPIAHKILIKLTYADEQKIVEMKRNSRGVFSLIINEDLKGYHYTFLIRVNGKWNETIDPYSSFSGPNARYSVVWDIDLIENMPPKVQLPKMNSNCDAIIYEANIRDMTSDIDVGVKHPKKFKGFVEVNENTRAKNTGFYYIQSLGVTHIQLLPVFDYATVDEEYPSIFYNWGYDPVQYRALEGSYSTDPTDAGLRVKEFADLVYRCHKAGLRVNLDLVFNHVYDKETFSLEQICPNYYFLMNSQGEFSNGSFCGNDIDSQPPMSRKFLVDTCKRIVEWFDVDGFRFDLMGILDINLMNEITEVCRSIKPDFMIYGEGWNMPSFVPENLRATQINQALMPRVGHFSDIFREAVRGSNSELEKKGFSSGDTNLIYACMDHMSASGTVYDSPQKVINYVECHDNHTLWDKNVVCCNNEDENLLKRRQILANAMVLLAQGVPFIHAGQEFGRTKQGLGNTYNRSDNYNHIDYSRRNQYIDIVSATRKLIQIRKNYSCFRLDTILKTREQVNFQTIEEKVLVYICQDENHKCISFFNPTGGYYNYSLDCLVEILMDNGDCNTLLTKNVQIAPYSVVVGRYKIDSLDSK